MNTLQRILELLKQSGVSDQEFIKQIGAKDKNLVFNWREDVTKSYTKYICQIADYFDVSVDYLLCRTNDPQPKDPALPDGSHSLVQTIGRDGRNITYRVTQEQLDAFRVLLEQMQDDETTDL